MKGKILSMGGKRAEISSTMIVTIILALIAFVIAMFFLYQFTWQETIDKETCHTSVVLRATLYSGKPVAREAVEVIPLKCKTDKICMTKKSFEFTSEGCGMKDERVIKVSDDEAAKKILADAMYDCWWQLGEGRVSFVKPELLGQQICAVCSLVKFDNTWEEREIDGFLDFILNEKIPNQEITYAEYFGIEKDKVEEMLAELEKKGISKKDLSVIDTSEEHGGYGIVFSLYEKGLFARNWKQLAGATLGVVSVVASAFTGGAAGVVLLVGGKVVGLTSVMSIFTKEEGKEFAASMVMVPFEEVDKLNCQEFRNIP